MGSFRCLARSLGLGLLLLMASARPALARELLFVGTGFPRVYMTSATGQPRGLAVDLLELVAARSGWTLRFESYPWPRAQLMVERGQAQILVGPYRTPERELRFSFSQHAFYEDALIFFARKSQSTLWTGDFEAIKPNTIVQVLGWAYGDYFEHARSGLKVSTVRDVETGVKMLAMGRVDLLATNERNTVAVLEAMGLTQDLVACSPPIAHLRGHFAFPRNAEGEALRDSLDQVLQQLRSSGELRELGRRWKVRLPE